VLTWIHIGNAIIDLILTSGITLLELTLNLEQLRQMPTAPPLTVEPVKLGMRKFAFGYSTNGTFNQ